MPLKIKLDYVINRTTTSIFLKNSPKSINEAKVVINKLIQPCTESLDFLGLSYQITCKNTLDSKKSNPPSNNSPQYTKSLTSTAYTMDIYVLRENI